MRYNTYFALKPLHLLCKITGLCPHSFNHDKKKSSRLLDVLWSFILIVLLAVTFIYRLVTSFQNHTRHPLWAADVTYVFTNYVAGLLCLIIGVTTQRKKCQHINFKMKRIDELFYRHSDRTRMYKNLRFTVIVSLTLMVLSIIPVCCFVTYFWRDFLPFNVFIGDQFCYLIVFIVSLRHVFYVKLLCDKFKCMNLQIGSLFQGIVCVNFDSDINNCANTCAIMHFARSRQSTIQPNNYENAVEPTKSETVTCNYRQCLIRIHRLKHLHVELHSITQLINFTFGMQVLLALTWLFVINSLAFHLVAKYIFNLSDMNNQIMRNNLQGIFGIVWSIFASLMLLLISVACHKTSEEAAMSVSLVHSLLLYPCFSPGISTELSLFCTQLKHLKIEFSACGLFAINLPFFYSIIGVTCTYVIFLCQVK